MVSCVCCPTSELPKSKERKTKHKLNCLVNHLTKQTSFKLDAHFWGYRRILAMLKFGQVQAHKK